MVAMKRGFTLIEVSLFLALTGVLFVMVAVGVSNSVLQQRFNDSVQNFADFFREVYSGVENVQNNIGNGNGRSDKAIYGKLVVFGAKNDLAGNDNEKNAIFVYDVIGDDKKASGSNIKDALVAVNVSIFEDKKNEEDSDDALVFAGRAESYSLRWGARAEQTGPSRNEVVGALLVARHPGSGTINTMFYSGTGFSEINNPNEYKREEILIKTLQSTSTSNTFTVGEVDFCVSLDDTALNLRRDVQLIKNASNASGINIIATGDNPCAV